MDSRIRDAILAVVPDDGRTIGNKSLFRDVRARFGAADQSFDDDAIEAVRGQLIAQSVLGKGRGRGGSVYLIQPYRDGDADGADNKRSADTPPAPGGEPGAASMATIAIMNRRRCVRT